MLPSNLSEFEVTNPPPKKGGSRVGGLVVMIALLVILVGVIVVAVTRLPTGVSRPSAAPAPGQPAAAAPAAQPGTPADAATQQAVKQVIQQLDDAQAQAIATNNPDLMAPTATPEFYQEEVASNQDLVDNGVTEVKLVNIEWGDITVDKGAATVTNYETWSTTFDDGTTAQSRDRNVYTLIQDNGTWKVQADDHPDQAAAGAPGQNPAPAPAP
jgi:hypothetical protein